MRRATQLPGWSALVMALVSPSLAEACGMCHMTVMARDHWWISSAPVVSLAFLLERLIHLIAYVLSPAGGLKRRWPWSLWLCVGFALLVLGSVMVPYASMLLFAGMMAGAFVLSFLLGHRRLVLDLLRVALVLIAVVSGVHGAWPERRSTDELVLLQTRNPVFWELGFRGWSIEQLQRRPDAAQTIERELERVRPERPAANIPSRREAALLQLHKTVVQETTFVDVWCASLDLANPAAPLEAGRACATHR